MRVGSNVVHVNDLVDNVTLESEAAGTGADLIATDELPVGKIKRGS